MEQGEFIAPKKNVVDFSEVRAGYSPVLPKITAEKMGQGKKKQICLRPLA